MIEKISAGIGRGTAQFLTYLGGLGFLLSDTFDWILFRGRHQTRRHVRVFRREEVVGQMVRFGYRPILIVMMVNLFIGVVLALQMAYILRQFGVQEYIASIVSVAMFREMGPLMTGILMAGFAGASVAAEIGTMVVGEEVMALETSAIEPTRFLIVPRLLALVTVIPTLTLVANFIGVLGGMFIGVYLIGIDLPLYWDKSLEYLYPKDILTGLTKSIAFSILIVALGCYEGLRVRTGALGVGRATTNTVVYSIIAIIGLDVIFTLIFFYLT